MCPPPSLTQNAAARLVFNLPECPTPLRSLHWLPVTARIHFKTLVPAYHAANGSGPSYIQDTVKPCTPARALRSASANRLAAPSLRAGPKFPSAGTRGFAVLAPRWWNELPLTSGQQKAHTPSRLKLISLDSTSRIELLTKHLYTNKALIY
ncbi:hypothetical protein CesoFtcFv8_023669 [Champsocephalus esox]|uniref:Uncharacterized protein n=1 Tax=Champsocephalus esox TaxID=159716 RepID=A0AAN8B4G7_9TELE|nr:hypothetical protein CesoFtcFv8_023669 [Champsocephalus esox]